MRKSETCIAALATTGEATSLDAAERDVAVAACARACAALHAEGRIPTADVRMPLANAPSRAVRAALGARP